MVCFRGHLVEGIDGKRSLDVAGRIEVDEIVGATAWNSVKEDVGQVAMRVEEGKAGAGVYVSRRETLKEDAFPCACLSEDVGVPEKIARCDCPGLDSSAPCFFV